MDQEELNLKADFVGYHIFIKLFDGDIDKWKKHLKEKGSMSQVIDDYQFILWLEEKLKKDPGLLDRIKVMVNESDLEEGDESIKSKGVE